MPGGSQSAKHSRNTPSVLALRPSQLPQRGSLRLRTTQSLPHKMVVPKAEGVAAEPASNHQPSGESAKYPLRHGFAVPPLPKGEARSSLGAGGHAAPGSPVGRAPQAFPPVTAERSKAAREQQRLPQAEIYRRIRTTLGSPTGGAAAAAAERAQQRLTVTTNPPANPQLPTSARQGCKRATGEWCLRQL